MRIAVFDVDPRFLELPAAVGCSPCECATCTAGIVLELGAPDARIAPYGFVEDTANWVFDCGIEEMWRFEIPH